MRKVFWLCVALRHLLTRVSAQLSLDTRGKNVLACLCCRGMLGCATLSALLLLRRCLLTAHIAR